MGWVRALLGRSRSRFMALVLGVAIAIAAYSAAAQPPVQDPSITACPELAGLYSYDDWVNFRDRQVALIVALESQQERVEAALQGMAINGEGGEASGINFEAQQQALTSQIAQVQKDIQETAEAIRIEKEAQQAPQGDGVDDLEYLEQPLKSTAELKLEDLRKQEGELEVQQRQLIVNKTIYDARSQELKGINEQLLQADRCKVETDKQVRSRLRQDAYRLWASIGFCLLVGLTIAAFFVTLQRSGAGAAEILAGDQGIQIMTLFLIVIAIILFGLLGILESKELSALLGGITGYILGRVSQENVRGLLSATPNLRGLLPGARSQPNTPDNSPEE